MASFEEENNILSAIFHESLLDSNTWSENPDIVKYVAELTSYGIDRLSREMDHLNEEEVQVNKQTEDLAFNNYKTFIETAHCSSDICKDFQVVESSVVSLLDKLPRFSQECQDFMDTAQHIMHSRKSNTLMLQKHTQLLEILEVPQLMDTCVRNNYYQEALELSAFVRRLEKKYSHLDVIRCVCEEVKSCSQLLLAQLLHQLRSELQLPACLRVIGFLRHMAVFTETELRLKFLQARDCWFQSVLAAIPKSDAFQHISKVIEASRIHLFDIITQYRAIFTDEETAVKAISHVPRESMLLQSWVQTKVDQFLETLAKDLEQGVGGRLDSLLGQCMYFGLSFSRVGCDFRALLIGVFEKAAVKAFSQAVLRGIEQFEANMEQYTLLRKSSHSLPSSAYPGEVNPLNPPQSLLLFNPLALLCNAILDAFNELRVCAPITIAPRITHSLQACLMKAADCIKNFHRLEHGSFTAEEASTFTTLCTAFCNDMLPYVNICLDALFPTTQISKALGISALEIQNAVLVCSITISEIAEPLREFLPEVETIPVNNIQEAVAISHEDSDVRAVLVKTPHEDVSPQSAVAGHPAINPSGQADDKTAQNKIGGLNDSEPNLNQKEKLIDTSSDQSKGGEEEREQDSQHGAEADHASSTLTAGIGIDNTSTNVDMQTSAIESAHRRDDLTQTREEVSPYTDDVGVGQVQD